MRDASFVALCHCSFLFVPIQGETSLHKAKAKNSVALCGCAGLNRCCL